jgi:oxygen-dependent protoporphyrinogen oxidase
MLGKLDPHSRKINVVGAGLSGLFVSYYLDKAGFEVTLQEASDRAGGLIQTQRSAQGTIETAAHSFLATPGLQALCEDLGVELSPVLHRARYIFRKGKLRRFPLTAFETLKTFGHAYFALSNFKFRHALTVDVWAKRMLGPAALEYLMAPFVRGIFGAEPHEILIPAAFPSLDLPPGHSLISYSLRKMIRGKRTSEKRGAMSAPRRGMGELISALDRRLQERLGSRFIKGQAVSALSSQTVICLPAYQAAELFSGSPELASALRSVRYTPLISVTCFVPTRNFKKVPRGVGVLIPPSEKKRILGILFNSSSFPDRAEKGFESFTVMLGGSADPGVLQCSDEEVRELIEKEFQTILGAKPEHYKINRWEKAIPLYGPELPELWALAQRTLPEGMLLFGNYTGAVSIRGMEALARNLIRTD